MKTTTASYVLSGISALAVAATLQAPQAKAQESGIESIVITARRGEETLQEVPATVTVVTESTIEGVNATTVEDLIELVPGVTIVTNTAEPGDNQINIRGINGTRDGESSVALVVDGILKTNTAVLNQVQNNLTQLEILKGPQGAYYGRNAAAGALVMQTKKPTDEWEFFGEGSFGNNATVTAALTAAGPISDNTGLLISADFRETDGFFRNTGPVPEAQGATVDPFQGYNLQARLVSEFADNATNDFKILYGDLEAGSVNYNVVFQLPNAAEAIFMNPDFNADVNDHEFVYLSNLPTESTQEILEISNKFDYDFDGLTLSAWALYSDVKQRLEADGAVAAFGFFNTAPECISSVEQLFATGFTLPSPLNLAGSPSDITSVLGAFSPTQCDGTQFQVRNQEDISLEIRLASDTGGPFEWSIGGYYLALERRVAVGIGYDRGRGIVPQIFNDQSSDNPTEQLSDDTFNTDVFAFFGSAEYSFTDSLTLSAALRYDREKRKVTNNVPPDATNQFLRGGGVPLNIALEDGPIPDQSRTFDEIQPRVSLAYTPNDSFTAFASWGVGFKSGGFNNQGSQAIIEETFNQPPVGAGLNIFDNYDKETSNAFEIGIKGNLFDNALTYELAGYYTIVDDLQFFEFYAGPFGILRVVSNIDEVELLGIEGAFNYSVTDSVNVFASFNVTDSEIKENDARPGTIGGESPYTPDYTLNAGIDVRQPITDALTITGRIDYILTGSTWFHTAQSGDRPTFFNNFFGEFGGTGNYTNSQRDSFDVVNLRVGIQAENWELQAFAENLFDTEYLDEVIPAPEFGGSFVSPGGRRYYGLLARFNF
ncbi:MAG: TonB-dependent receptor [Pseudomonadota bacterium]